MGWWVVLEAEEWAEAGSFAWVPPHHRHPFAQPPVSRRAPAPSSPLEAPPVTTPPPSPPPRRRHTLVHNILHVRLWKLQQFPPAAWLESEEGKGTRRKGMAGAQGVGSTRRVEMVPGCWCWCRSLHVVVAVVVVVVVIVVVVTVVVKVAVVVANRRCEGDEFRVYIKFGPHQ